MRKLALTLLLFAGGIAVVATIARTPRVERTTAPIAAQVVEGLAPHIEGPLDKSGLLAVKAVDEQRELVVVEPGNSARSATADGAAARPLDPDQYWAHVRVVDGASGNPIERFGARVSRRTTSMSEIEGVLTTSIAPVRHDDGRVDIATRSREEMLQIEAPGYAPSESPLPAGAFANEVQAVELTCGASVAGRVMLGDAPAKSVRVRLQRASLVDPAQTNGDDDTFDLTRFVGRPRSLSTSHDGVFVFEDLAFGTYELDLRRSDGARAFVGAIKVTAAERLEVGDLRISPGATLRGRALLPPGAEPERVRLFVQARRTQTVQLDPSGDFAIEDLSAGSCKVVVREQSDVIVAGPPFEFELAAGETREVVLDLRDRGGMWIEARVRSGGRPFRDGELVFDAQRRVKGRTGSVEMKGSGASWRCWQARTQRVSVRVESTKDMPLGQYEREVVLLPDGNGLVELDLELADLSVDWRQITQPDYDECEVIVVTLGNPPLAGLQRVNGQTHNDGALAALTRREFDLGPVLAERVEVTLRFIVNRGPEQSMVQFQRTLDLSAGEHAVCTFTDSDRFSVAASSEREPPLGY